MFDKIIRLEKAFDFLLPVGRLTAPPGKELLEAARTWSEEVWKESKVSGPLPLSQEQLHKGLHLIQRPVFICGVHRSGTTLVRDLLDAHPSLAVLPAEGSFLTNLAAPFNSMSYEKGECFLATEWLRRLANPINQAPYWVLGRSTVASSSYVDFARAFSSWYPVMEESFKPRTSIWPHLAVVLAYATSCQAPETGLAARLWVDKTPTQEKYLEKIWLEMPEAKIIHVVRAPVDVFLSRKRMEPSLNLKACLRDLELSYRIALKQVHLNPNKYLLVRYEEVCQSPQSVISSITEFLGIERHPCLYTPTVSGKPAQVNSSFHLHLPAGSILDSQVYLHQESSLQKQEGRLLSVYLFKPASQLGYSLKPIGKLLGRMIKIRFELKYFFLHKFLVLKRYTIGYQQKIKSFVTKVLSE